MRRIILAAAVLCNVAVAATTDARQPALVSAQVPSYTLYLPVALRGSSLPPPILELVSQVGGAMEDVAIDGDVALAGVGSRLTALDLSDPRNMLRLGESPILAGTVDAVAASDGYAYALAGGLVHVIDVTNPAQMTVSGVSGRIGSSPEVALAEGFLYAVTVDERLGAETRNEATRLMVVDVRRPNQPAVVGSLELPGVEPRIAVTGGYAYVVSRLARSAEESLVHAIDVRVPAAPCEVGSAAIRASIWDIAAVPGALYLGAHEGLVSLGLTDPSHPRAGSTVPGSYNTLRVDGHILLALDQYPSLHAFSIADPLLPVRLGLSRSLSANISDASAGGGIWCAATGTGLLVVDVSDPSRPTPSGEYEIPLPYPDRLAVDDGIAHVLSYHDSRLWIVDARQVSDPAVAGSLDLEALARAMAVLDGVAYLGIDRGLQMVDVTRPSAPSALASLECRFPLAIAAAHERAFIADGDGLRIIDTSDLERPHVAGWLALDGAVTVAVADDLAYVGIRGLHNETGPLPGSLRVVDAANPALARELGSFGAAGSVWDVALVPGATGSAAGTALLAETVSGGEGRGDLLGLRSVDVSVPHAPRDNGFLAPPSVDLEHDFPRPRIAVESGRAYVADHFAWTENAASYERGAIWVVDVARAGGPTALDWIPTPGWAFDVAAEGEYLYVADFDAGLSIYRVVW